eukprot:TRINITY_DN68125_c6_g4_i1.p1 TRINITY_DN68125_c6_g4~~TRINITY_DN68125_c6_g4_i1.p1  ORF type:complete len:359 (-),score=28.46 TRINITY_DN68125_c6_g4_i1:81-1157(-)
MPSTCWSVQESDAFLQSSFGTTFKCLMSELQCGVLSTKTLLTNHQQQWNFSRELVDEINSREAEDILFLDVGGTEIHVSQSVLQSPHVSDSMLGVWLSGDWEWSIDREKEDGLIFIDRDGTVFQQGGILDFLRDGSDHILFDEQLTPHWWWRHNIPAVNSWLLSLCQEAVYFGLSELSAWCKERYYRKIFTHHDSRGSVGPGDYPNRGVFGTSTVWSGINSPDCCVPALTGNATFQLKVTSDTATGYVGFFCKCSTKERSPASEDQPGTFEMARCAWYCYVRPWWDGVCGDVIGVHVGKRTQQGGKKAEQGTQSIWLTKNGTVLFPRPVEDARSGKPPTDKVMLAPYLAVLVGTVQTC